MINLTNEAKELLSMPDSDNYLRDYRVKIGETETLSGSSSYDYYGGGYICSGCGQWVPANSVHVCSGLYGLYSPYGYYGNKTKQAYQIIRALVQEKIIPEPESYQKFCDLIEAIKKAI